ncbi:MAG: UDP-N-acetylmuramoyl-tripeptide--D-alanyl-D-alanine ligase [Opitutaceae bacterium]
MPTFDPEQLAQWSEGRWTRQPAAPLAAFSFDTRKLRGGDVFVALKTGKRDGHDFLADARAAGASAALVTSADPAVALPQLVVNDTLAAFQTIAREHRRGFRGPIVGVSGSAGKTSTKDLLALLLGGASGGVLATEGNLNNHLGVPLTLTRIDPAQHKFAVVEAGISTPGEMAPLARMIEPDVAIITLVAPAHTEELGGVGGVAREKSILPAMTRPHGVAIFPQSVAEFPAFRELGVRTLVVERVEVLRAGEPAKNRVYFSVSHRADSTAVQLASSGRSREYVFRRVSDGMAQNATLAIITARWLGVAGDLVQARLAAWKPAKLRGEIRRLDGRLLYLDCYNANPASMADALAAFESVAPGGASRLFVIGCMEELGTDAAAHHQALGRSLQLRDNDQLFVIGTHAHDICAGVLQQGDFTRQIQIVSTLEPVSAFLADWRGSVFVKGSRRYQLEKILEVQTSLPLPC